MPAEQQPGSVVVTTWEINTIEDAREFEDAMVDLGLATVLHRRPDLPAAQQLKIQVDIPDKPREPILIQEFGAQVRAITMDDTLISLEKLAGEG